MERTVQVRHEHGLHARPAAAFVQTAAGYAAEVAVTNLSTGRGPAPARSIIGILGLGVRQGHQVRLEAEGPDAAAALAGLAGILESGPAT